MHTINSKHYEQVAFPSMLTVTPSLFTFTLTELPVVID